MNSFMVPDRIVPYFKAQNEACRATNESHQKLFTIAGSGGKKGGGKGKGDFRGSRGGDDDGREIMPRRGNSPAGPRGVIRSGRRDDVQARPAERDRDRDRRDSGRDRDQVFFLRHIDHGMM